MIGKPDKDKPLWLFRPRDTSCRFSVNEVDTQVSIFDGATVIIGGLTREEVKTVNDKIPVLGNIHTWEVFI